VTVRRRVGRCLLACAWLSVVVGCDGGPGFTVSIELANGCGENLAVAAFNGATPPARAPNEGSGETGILRSGDSRVFDVADVQEPAGDIAHVWAVREGSSTWGEAIEISLDGLPEVTLSGGSTARRLTIEGDICPKG
jgi:hypothetical protein